MKNLLESLFSISSKRFRKSRGNCRFLHRKREKRECRGASAKIQIVHLKIKVYDNFHARVLRNSEKKKKFVRANFAVFQTNYNLLLSKDENR